MSRMTISEFFQETFDASFVREIEREYAQAHRATIRRKKMGKFSISWQETYEMTVEVEAPTYEEAMKKAGELMDGSPTLEFLDAWQAGGEDSEGVSTVFMDETIEAELSHAQGPFCVPVTDEDEEEEQQLTWPSDERSGQ
jgi:hypothetical protein